MRMTADFCRAQAALHRGKAETDPLENRRKIARDAAKAWEIEALAAEERDAKVRPPEKRDGPMVLVPPVGR